MSLEERVDLLEAEFKILKNQIQGVLLDIQEQVLVHYYPLLRSYDDDTGLEDADTGVAVVVGAVNTGVSLEAATPQKSSPVPTQPAEIPGVATSPDVDVEMTGAAVASGIPWETFTQMLDWVYEMVGKIGAERTRKAVELYVRKEGLSSEVRDTLFQLIALLE